MNPLIQGYSGTAPETSRNAFSVNQGTNEDDSQSGRHPEAGLFHNQTTRNSDPEDGHDMVTGVQKECPYGHDRYFFEKLSSRSCFQTHGKLSK